VKNTQDITANDVHFLGLQKSFGVREFYVELIDKIVEQMPRQFSGPVTILEDPGRSISCNSESDERSPRIVLGGGLEGHFEHPYNPISRSFWGARGYLTLNRLPRQKYREVVIGELAILASRLDSDEYASSDILYVGTGTEVRTEDFFNELSSIGSDYVSVTDGLAPLVGRVKSARLVISDGVIGLAVADSFGVPSVWHRDGSSPSRVFQVMDYLSGVNRPLHQHVSTIPSSRGTLEKKSRVASSVLVMSQIRKLEENLNELVDLQTSVGPSDTLFEPILLQEEAVYVPLHGNGINAGALEFEYSYSGDKKKQQVVVSLDLVSRFSDISEVDRLPNLGKSGRSDIGFYRYLDLMQGTGKVDFPIALPDGFHCKGFRILRWHDPNSKIQFQQVTAAKFR